MSEIEAALSRIEMTAEIVSAYVGHNSAPVADLPGLIKSVHDALGLLSGDQGPVAVQEAPQPKVPIRKSVSNDFIVCLEDGRHFKSLKRHLHSEHGMSPDEYRAKWDLGKDYPMVAPAYADARSTLAKTIGLGRKSAPSVEAEASPAGEAETEPGVEGAGDDPGPAKQDAAAKKPGRRKVKAG